MGYNVSEGRRDPWYYDLLASEARLATFVAIATGKLSPEALVQAGPHAHPDRQRPGAALVERVDVEYLMPILVMRSIQERC